MKTLWRAVRPHLPRAAVEAVAAGRRGYLRLRCRLQDARDRRLFHDLPLPADQAPLPPAWLRYRVDGTLEASHFLAVGRNTARDILAALDAVGSDLTRIADVLDFGCGCGRTLPWLAREWDAIAAPSPPRWHGSDIDAEAIAWCRDHLPFAHFAVNDALPPLDAADGSYDLIYAISVFTHLDLDRQRAWLAELRRVTRPGGHVVLTVHGAAYAGHLDSALRQRLDSDGFLFVSTDATRRFFPDWYQASYQTPAQVQSSFGAFFRVLAHLPQGINGYQDAVVLRRE